MNPGISQWIQEIILMSNKIFNIMLKKKYGQNFLIDQNIIKKTVDALEIKSEDVILEIGPGLGVLTRHFFVAKKIILIEIDRDLVNVLKNEFAQNQNTKIINSNIKIINSDVLKIDFNKLLAHEKNIKIVSNLPYYISTPVIIKCLQINKNIDLKFMIFMTQKEVADRILSEPNKKTYGSLSVFAQYNADIKFIEKNIPPDCFMPKPKVNSSLIKLTPKQNFYKIKDLEDDFLFSVIKKSFSKRRKTLVNCLENFRGLNKNQIADILLKDNLNPKIRAEALSINNFINLALNVKQIINW